MAKKPERTPPQRTGSPAGARRASVKPLLWVFMFTLTMFVFPAMVMVLIVGMLPTLVAAFVDKTPKKFAAWCVGGMNLAGVFPSLQDLWAGETTIRQAMSILGSPADLLVMYAAAAFGWMIYIAVPPVIRSIMTVVAQHRIAQLRSDQRNLIGEWGAGIADQALLDED